MGELKIAAKITVKKEFQDEMEQIFHTLVDATRGEEGNISYELHQNVNNELEYTILEVWKSQDAINIHNETPHFINFKNGIDGKVDNLSIDLLKKIY